MGDSQSVVLADGSWMIGICCSQFVGYTMAPLNVVFNENTLTYSPVSFTGDGQATENDEAGFNLLPYNPAAPNDSQVLMINVPLGAYDANLKTSQVWDETTGNWAAQVDTAVQLWDADCGNSAAASYELGPVMLLPNGKLWGTGSSLCAAGHTALYDPVAGTWSAMPDFPNKGTVLDAPGATEINGKAIVATSPYTSGSATPVTFYEFDPSTNTISALPANPPRASTDTSFVGHLLVLPNGQILWTDYQNTGMAVYNSVGTYDPSWQPTITTAPSSLTIGQTYPISGTQFNGVSTGASYGDDYQPYTNYPLVRIVNTASGHVFYARTHDHSSMGVQTGSLPVSTNFDVPVMETGACQLYVVANGIPSAPSACNVGQPAGIYSPVNGTPLSSTTVTFQWGGDANATAYWLDIGSSAGGNNLYSSGSLPTSTLSLTIPGLPLDGSKIYVRWYEMVGGTFQPTDYTYTSIGGANNKGSINTPAPGSTLTSAGPAFTWSAGVNATAYWLTAGSTLNGSDYYSSGNLGNVVTVTSSKLPTNGSAVYVTLYSLVGGSWLSNNYTYTSVNSASGAGPVMTTPAPSSTLTSATVTFNWSRLSGATGYWLDAGSTPGSHNYFSSGAIASGTRSSTARGLPTNGSTIYVTLYGLISGVYYASPYTYTAFNPATTAATMQTPAPGSTFTNSSVTFTWSAGSGATAYWLDLGSTAGAHNYFSSGNLGNVLTTSVSGLPTDGSTVYATLYALAGGIWTGSAYTYTALNATSGLAAMQSPTPGTTLSGSSATFGWSPDTNATGYWLDIGTAPGGNTIYSSGNLGTNTSTNVFSLPADGSTIYVTLYSLVGGQWLSNSYTYVSGP
jgi:hypothetical protein